MSTFFKLLKTCDSEEKFAEFENTIAKFIAKFGDINENDIGGKLLFHICECNYSEFAPRMIELLIKRGANVNFIEKSEKINSLMCALQYNHNESVVKITELLINAGIDINFQDKMGQNSLMHALIDYGLRKHCDYTYVVVEKLLIANADPNIKNNYNKHVINYCKNDEIIELLFKYGAILDYENMSVKSCLALVSFKNKQIAELEKKNAELEEKNAELLSIMDYIPNGSGYENCAEDYNKNLNLRHYEIANE